MHDLVLVHLYPALLNLYGDRGNIITLRQRCAWRGINLKIVEVGLGDILPVGKIDLMFMGGDQDREQSVVVDDLRRRHGDTIKALVHEGLPLLAVCGSFQLLQHMYRPGEGDDLEGIGLFDAHTVHPGHTIPRCVGNIVVEWDGGTIVGFENHGGRTFLGPDARPLGHVVSGFGNNGEDGLEGARVCNAIGTYVHGSLLPKNPALADYLLGVALERRSPGAALEPLGDELEHRAHDAAVKSALAGAPSRRD